MWRVLGLGDLGLEGASLWVLDSKGSGLGIWRFEGVLGLGIWIWRILGLGDLGLKGISLWFLDLRGSGL
jgi:hypothetical protein